MLLPVLARVERLGPMARPDGDKIKTESLKSNLHYYEKLALRFISTPGYRNV
jgi:hypothetical protein